MGRELDVLLYLTPRPPSNTFHSYCGGAAYRVLTFKDAPLTTRLRGLTHLRVQTRHTPSVPLNSVGKGGYTTILPGRGTHVFSFSNTSIAEPDEQKMVQLLIEPRQIRRGIVKANKDLLWPMGHTKLYSGERELLSDIPLSKILKI